MKKTFIFSILLMLFLLTSCNNVEVDMEVLDVVTNLSSSKNVLKFDKVNNARQYIVNYNGKNQIVDNNEYVFEEEGLFKVRVKSRADGYVDSLFSEVFEIDVKFLSKPENIYVSNRVIYYDEVKDADSYIIKINETEYDTSKHLITALENGVYKISVKAISNKYVDSEFSEEIEVVIDENTLIESINKYTYSSNSSFDLPLYKYLNGCLVDYQASYITSDNNEISIDKLNLYIIEDTVYLKADIAKSLPLNEGNIIDLRLTTNLGNHKIEINFTDELKPYIYSDSVVKSSFNDDIFFIFETFETSFISVSGNDIKPDDYTFENGILTIKNEYIKGIFAENLDRNKLILTYRYDKNDVIYLGFITINK